VLLESDLAQAEGRAALLEPDLAQVLELGLGLGFAASEK